MELLHAIKQYIITVDDKITFEIGPKINILITVWFISEVHLSSSGSGSGRFLPPIWLAVKSLIIIIW
jgi:hypothetical protein